MPSLPFAAIDNWLSPPPRPAKVNWLGLWDYAHRGLHGVGLPENSPAAFAAAMERGMGIECDIQLSGDGQAMVFHDAVLDRLTAEQGRVADRSADELGRIAITGGTDTIPTLRQLLEKVAGWAPLLIEIKSPKSDASRIPALCQSVHRELEGYGGAHAIMSFDPRIVRWFSRHAPLTVRGLVVTEEDDKALPGMVRRRLSLWHARPDFLAYDVRDLPSRFAAGQRQRGLPVLTWTVRNAEYRDRAAAHADAPIAEGAGVR